jgi:hypothetical protein
VEFRELSWTEFKQAGRLAQQYGGGGSLMPGVDESEYGLRLALVSDAGEALTYKDVEGGLLSKRFRTREILLLLNAFGAVHSPGNDELTAAARPRIKIGG